MLPRLLISIYLVFIWSASVDAKSTKVNVFKKVRALKKKYRSERIDAQEMWQNLETLEKKHKRASKNYLLLQQKSFLMQEENFYSLSLMFALDAISNTKNPFSKKVKASWHLAYDALKKGDVHDLLLGLARTLKNTSKKPPIMGRNWFFFKGLVAVEDGDLKKAMELFSKVESQDFIYLATRYEMAMSHIKLEQIDKAYKVLKDMIVIVRSKAKRHMSAENRMEIGQLARLALARLDYEQKKYVDSVKNYRRVRRESKRFYTALSEQSWALFMAGFPNHALGTIYSAESPFFEGRFNPELPLLKSIIYFWICRYKDSRVALVDFIDRYSKPVKELDGFLNRKNLSALTAYSLLEKVLSDGTTESLGISRDLLESVAMSETMMMHRHRLAKSLEELGRLNSDGIWLKGFIPKSLKTRLTLRVKNLKRDLGKAYLKELEAMRREYDRLRGQLDFLYVELLISEKENLYGRELHETAKIKKAPEKTQMKGWGAKALSWASDNKDEFWIDEIGFYIFDMESQCKS